MAGILKRYVPKRYKPTGILGDTLPLLVGDRADQGDTNRIRDGFTTDLSFDDLRKQIDTLSKEISLLKSRIVSLESVESQEGRLVALCAGTLTAGGLSTSFTISREFGMTVSTLSTTSVIFLFDEPRVSSRYWVGWGNYSGTSTGANWTTTGETQTGFSLNTLTGTGNVNPRTIGIEFVCVVLDRDKE